MRVGVATASRAATAEAKRPSAMPIPNPVRSSISEDLADRRDDAFAEALVAAVVTRRPAGFDAQPPRLDDLQSRGQLVDGAHHRFELTGIAISVVVEEHRFGTALLGHAATLSDSDADGAGRR